MQTLNKRDERKILKLFYYAVPISRQKDLTENPKYIN